MDGKNLAILGDKVRMEVDVVTNMGIKKSIQDFFILENDAESLVMGVQWYTSLVGEKCGELILTHLGQSYRIPWIY